MKITEDGIYPVKQTYSTAAIGTSVVLVSGDLGGGTATLGYYDEESTFIPFTDGEMIPGEQLYVHHGLQIRMFAEVVGSSGANLLVTCAGIR